MISQPLTLTWLDGAITEHPVLDPGLLYGHGVFETILVMDGTPFGVDAHLDRLGRGARTLELPAPERSLAHRVITDLLASSSPRPMARLRLTWTPGADHLGAMNGTLAPYEPLVGLDVVMGDHVRNERSPLVGVKSTAYVENLLALRRAQRAGAQEVLFINTRDELCEGATSNIFIETRDGIHTPPLDSGCLPGTTRAWCLKWAAEEGIEIHQGPIPAEQVRTIEHAAMSSSLKGLTHVTSLAGRGLEPGPRLQELKELFESRRVATLTT